MGDTDKLTFLSEWFDPVSSTYKKFLLTFYPSDDTVELFDRDLNRIYLRRTYLEGIALRDFFLGNSIRIYNRQVKITDYADTRTKIFVGKSKQRTLAIIKPTAIKKLAEIIIQIEEHDFMIVNMQMIRLSIGEARNFYKEQKDNPSVTFLVEHLSSGPIVVMELIGLDAVARWKACMGPADPNEARRTHPESFRAVYGQEILTNAFHGSETCEDVSHETSFFFPEGSHKHHFKAELSEEKSTCCVVKPHVVRAGKLGQILLQITDSGFSIRNLQMFRLSSSDAEEFLEVYKGVVDDYNAFLHGFLNGPCVVLEICGEKGINVQDEFRRLVGPLDPDIARKIRPQSIRARFGDNKHNNAVHCTDLPEDTMLELEYFFKIL